MNKTGFAILTTLVILSCAHKAPPLFKDRVKPKLQKIQSLNNRQVQFVFSEDIDTLGLTPDWFTITSKEETLGIITVYPSLSASELVAVTEPQIKTEYDVTGWAFDTAQNKGTFSASFIGATTPDTIAPRIVDYSKGHNQHDFKIAFSEAMDTSFLEYYIIPKKNLTPVWLNLRVCRFTPEAPSESLHYDTTYYLFIKNGVRDISGNTPLPFITSVTPDSIPPPFQLKAEVHLNDTIVKNGYALLKKPHIAGITFVKDGGFSFSVRDTGAYEVEVISGEYSGSARIRVDTTNIINLEHKKKNLDNIIN